MSDFEAVIGLEVHAQLNTSSKLFASSGTTAGKPANTLTDPTTLGLPGCLPVLNKRTIDCAIKLGLALDCQIANESIFARKHYHYPDLPKGYQISQYDKPICLGGQLRIAYGDSVRDIGITRIHMEEDAGKTIHLDTEATSIVDLNRAGVPLLEIVSEPDMREPAEASAYMRELRRIVRFLDICDGNMEEGSLRCDANVSVRLRGEEKLGTKVEIKNLNSFRFVEKALEYEIARQTASIQQGQEIVQETRLWDEHQEKTRPMRSKEFAEDYRYFPDPDLLPLVVDFEWIARIRETMPELPHEIRKRFTDIYKLDAAAVDQLTSERIIAQYFETAVVSHDNSSTLANWITTELFGRLNREGLSMTDCPVSPENLAALVRLIDDNTISGKIAKTIFDEMFDTGASPSNIVDARGLRQISDPALLTTVIDRVLAENTEQVAAYREGKAKLFGFFVGQIMKETGGKANPALLNELLRAALDIPGE